MEELKQLVKRNDVRSADRASMRSMLDKLRHGKPLSYQERQNLWAYIVRYTQHGLSDRPR